MSKCNVINIVNQMWDGEVKIIHYMCCSREELAALSKLNIASLTGTFADFSDIDRLLFCYPAIAIRE